MTALTRAEVERYRHESWLVTMLTEVQASLPRFREGWQRAEQDRQIQEQRQREIDDQQRLRQAADQR